MQKHDSQAGYGRGYGEGFALELYECKTMTNKVNTPILIDGCGSWMRVLIIGRNLDQIKHFFGSKFPLHCVYFQDQ